MSVDQIVDIYQNMSTVTKFWIVFDLAAGILFIAWLINNFHDCSRNH